MALFSEKVNKDIKARLAGRLLTLKNDRKNRKKKTQKLVKPKFPRIGHNTQLHELLTEESLEFFSIIKVDYK